MICNEPECTKHYGCWLRNKGIQVSPKATPNRVKNPVPSKMTPPARYGQLMYDERPGGTRVPIMNSDGTHMRGKQFDDNKRLITNNIRRVRSGNADPS